MYSKSQKAKLYWSCIDSFSSFYLELFTIAVSFTYDVRWNDVTCIKINTYTDINKLYFRIIRDLLFKYQKNLENTRIKQFNDLLCTIAIS